MVRSFRRTKGLRWAIAALSLLLLLFLLFGAETTKNSSNVHPSKEFVLITDAGSTGTRFYLFPKDIATHREIPSAALLEIEHAALHQQTPETAFDYAKPGLSKALETIPEGATLRWYLYGTAGMRHAKTFDLYNALREGAVAACENHTDKRLIVGETRTLYGDEEGYFAALAVNYLAGRLTQDLRVIPPPGDNQKKLLYGALDLGGSSTQIAYARDNNNNNEDEDDSSSSSSSGNNNLRRGNHQPQEHQPAITTEDFYMHSYEDYGANSMREKVFELFRLYDTNNPSATHPCLFQDDTQAIGDRTWEGSGDARGCIGFLENVVLEKGNALRSVNQPPPAPGTLFYAFGVYYYAVRFAHDAISRYYSDGALFAPFPPPHLDLPNPTLRDLTLATEWICKLEAQAVHRPGLSSDTPPEQVYRRCFDLSYIVVLLRRLRASAVLPRDDNGNNTAGGFVYFVNDMDGHKVSWTIGAYLTVLAREREEREKQRKLVASRLRLAAWMVGMLVLAMLVGPRYRHNIRSWFQSWLSPTKDASD